MTLQKYCLAHIYQIGARVSHSQSCMALSLRLLRAVGMAWSEPSPHCLESRPSHPFTSFHFRFPSSCLLVNAHFLNPVLLSQLFWIVPDCSWHSRTFGTDQPGIFTFLIHAVTYLGELLGKGRDEGREERGGLRWELCSQAIYFIFLSSEGLKRLQVRKWHLSMVMTHVLLSFGYSRTPLISI